MDINALRFPNHSVVAAAAAMMLRARFPSPQLFQQQVHFFGVWLASSAVDDSLPACPDIGIDFDSCSLDIFSRGLVAALSRAVSADFAPAPIDGSVDGAGGVLAAGDGGALETGGETLVCGDDDGLSLQATSAAAAVIAISR
jgi:hypothetical protein